MALDLFFIAILIILALIPSARHSSRQYDHRGTRWASSVSERGTAATAPAGPPGAQDAHATIKNTKPRVPV